MPIYSDWITWHEGTVDIIHGGAPLHGTWHHESTLEHDGTPYTGPTSGPIQEDSGSIGNVEYSHGFGSPNYPGLQGGVECAWGYAKLGEEGSAEWDGTCPITGFGLTSSVGGHHGGSGWFASNQALSEELPGGGFQATSVNAIISGFLFLPWSAFSTWTSQFFNASGGEDDPDLYAEWAAAVTDSGYELGPWQIEWEAFHPILVGMDWAPDEYTGSGGGPDRSGTVYWVQNATGWGLTYNAGTDTHEVAGPGHPAGDVLFSYSGGTADWTPVPDELLPEQDPDSGVFVYPEDGTASAVVLNLYHDTIWADADIDPPAPGAEASGGRFGETIAVRVRWRPPRFRFVRDAPVEFPRRVVGVPAPSRVYPRGRQQRRSNPRVGGVHL